MTQLLAELAVSSGLRVPCEVDGYQREDASQYDTFGNPRHIETTAKEASISRETRCAERVGP
jgi:hypothetical protein